MNEGEAVAEEVEMPGAVTEEERKIDPESIIVVDAVPTDDHSDRDLLHGDKIPENATRIELQETMSRMFHEDVELEDQIVVIGTEALSADPRHHLDHHLVVDVDQQPDLGHHHGDEASHRRGVLIHIVEEEDHEATTVDIAVEAQAPPMRLFLVLPGRLRDAHLLYLKAPLPDLDEILETLLLGPHQGQDRLRQAGNGVSPRHPTTRPWDQERAIDVMGVG